MKASTKYRLGRLAELKTGVRCAFTHGNDGGTLTIQEDYKGRATVIPERLNYVHGTIEEVTERHAVIKCDDGSTQRVRHWRVIKPIF